MNAIRILLILTALALTSGCASNRANNPADPLESFNRGVYKFNDTVDKAVIKPVAQGYDTVMPEIGKTMVSNFFSNLDDVIVTANDFLQLKMVQGALDAMRFAVNTTVGLYGLIDVGTQVGLEKHNEDFGQTLGKWGIGNGPYIVLPILGPSTLRDSVGLYADSRPSKVRRVEHMRTRNQLYAGNAISHRAQMLDQEKILDEAAVDRYEFTRDAYLLHRKNLVYDGNPPREKYDDEENNDTRNNGAKSEQTPASRTASVQIGNPPAIQPDSSMIKPASAATSPQPDANRPSVYRIWVAQYVGIR
ncbi:MAG: MlaA family lipoprotein [Gallionellaceae bacterium]|jgi:phospholipid-binding lipoprotein MlaA|nr:MlaA family lipoprotein [Gallionellaceae bacterium]